MATRKVPMASIALTRRPTAVAEPEAESWFDADPSFWHEQDLDNQRGADGRQGGGGGNVANAGSSLQLPLGRPDREARASCSAASPGPARRSSIHRSMRDRQ